MAASPDELRAAMDEAFRRMTEAWMAGDDYGTETYGERLSYL
jgi:hypothetical protein